MRASFAFHVWRYTQPGGCYRSRTLDGRRGLNAFAELSAHYRFSARQDTQGTIGQI